MRNSAVHAIRTYAKLPDRYQRHIGPDWFDVIDLAERLRKTDGLIDGTVPRTLLQCGMSKEQGEIYDAYHYFLFNYFLFGEVQKVKSAERRRAERGQ